MGQPAVNVDRQQPPRIPAATRRHRLAPVVALLALFGALVMALPASASTTPTVGDVYIADFGNSRVVEVPAGGGPQTTVGSVSFSDAVAVDAAGDVYIADTNDGLVVEVPAGGGPQITVASDFPQGVAVDAAGDVYIADNNIGQVVEVPAGGGPPTTVASGLSDPFGVAVDAAGDVYIADAGNNQVVEVPAGGGPQTTVGSGLSSPHGVAVDAAGDVYIADAGNNQVVEVPAGGGPQTTVGSGLSSPQGVAVDAAGDVYVGDTGNNRVVEVPAGGGPQTTVGSGLSSPQGVAVFAPPPTFVTDTAPASAAVGESYSFTYTAATPAGEPTATFALSSGSLPPGVTLDPTTGVLSGTPTTAGTFSFVVQTQNVANATLAPSTTVTVAAAAQVPTVSAISPTAGPTKGGTPVAITGTGFAPGSTVAFGKTPATGVTVTSATSISAVAPAGTGTADVTVTTPNGTSVTSAVDQFTYDIRPSVRHLSTYFGPTKGGTRVTVTGTGFTPGATVEVGAKAATDVVVNSATTLTFTTPPNNRSVRVVTVTTPGGASAPSLLSYFTYL